MSWFGGDGSLSERKKRKLVEGRRKSDWYSRVGLDAPSFFSGILIPPKGFVKLKHFWSMNLSSGVNQTWEVIYQSSIYQPVVFGGNPNPVLGYGWWSQFYREYQVTGMKVTQTVISLSSSSRPLNLTIVSSCGLNPSPLYQSVVPSEIPGLLGARTGTTFKASDDRIRLSYFKSTAEAFGEDSLEGLGDTSSRFGTSPVSKLYMHCLLYWMDSLASSISGYTTIETTYYVMLSQPKVSISPTGVASSGPSVGVGSCCEEDRLAAERDSAAYEQARQRVSNNCGSPSLEAVSCRGGSRVGVGLGVVPSVVPSEFI